MMAAIKGCWRVAKILLSRRANASIAGDNGTTALHLSALNGHLAVTVDLVKAGADLHARTSDDATPLHLAAKFGHSEVLAALIEAGADVDSRWGNGRTPLYTAALSGHLDVVKELLRARANPLVATTSLFPLEIAAHNGHSKVVRELVEQVGIEGCGGKSGGVQALKMAAQNQHVDIMVMLTDAGEVDSGAALYTATGRGREASVNFLLRQRRGRGGTSNGGLGYANSHNALDHRTLLRSISGVGDEEGVQQLISPKVVRLLIDAGADTSSAVRVSHTLESEMIFDHTPLAFTIECIRSEEMRAGKYATEEHMHRLEAVACCCG